MTRIVEREAEAVKECFHRRTLGASYQSLADYLNGEGFITRRGNQWSYEAVREMLSNPFYKGFVSYEGELYPGQHEAIVSEELWERAQKQKRTRSPHAKPGTRGLLQGRARCIRCCRPLHASKHRESFIYRERHRYECETRGRSITSRGIDEQIGRIVRSIRLGEGTDRAPTSAVVRDRSRGRFDPARVERAKVLFIDGHITRDEFDRIIRESEPVEPEPVNLATVKEFQSLMADLPALWQELNHQERFKVIGTLVQEAYIDLDRGMVGAIAPVPELDWLMSAACEADDKVVLVDLRGLTPQLTPPSILWPDPIVTTLPVWRVAA